ncbi:hypothetical protein WJ0W_005465 [Paenibacillus melissococcoides]|uniref:Uncharacterized protein n=1 Tax=Paenibacillus melissococcoides TaxID=2912268 RepID=A0ABM9G8D7_9BACL|nr:MULTISPECIES: hypothetical protein [Paenibacillus]MEB9897122.1 hypothetical protein [Bacillus cereus]CAH8248207.1 hypothetical protein WJ0W_005465 [Paenibacillus melissococcoides]CAH8718158.1 hypothetical protein HTL2_005181 [Paenibacillus melissococcoides]CAH8718964.1 hypothetical protein WDD9_005392 [Paenibacillus melissococcoides]GIO82349.1 hypothetical protein J6TS7_59590 [Paenibacillus dendritiformis]
MEKELDVLINYFEEYISELQKELEQEPNSEFIKGQMKGMNQALRITRMLNKPDPEHCVDIIID